jgi:hypothetical protein
MIRLFRSALHHKQWIAHIEGLVTVNRDRLREEESLRTVIVASPGTLTVRQPVSMVTPAPAPI